MWRRFCSVKPPGLSSSVEDWHRFLLEWDVATEEGLQRAAEASRGAVG